MKRILIGHRGVGKTSLLKRHQEYFKNIPHYDLDSEIEKQVNIPVSNYFEKNGEAIFRQIEKQVFLKLIQQPQFVLSLGAGFDVMLIPKDIEVVFVSRTTDQDGRIFLNRPRLEPQLSALEEYRTRYQKRHVLFQKCANWIYYMPEGIDDFNIIEQKIFTQNYKLNDAYITLTPQDLKNFSQDRQEFQKIELRTDLLTDEQISDFKFANSNKQILLSIRSSTLSDLKSFSYLDFDLHFFDLKYKKHENQFVIVSSHFDQIENGIEALALVPQEYHLKLCPLVNSIVELKAGYHWQQQDPQNRSFLPRSTSGKWLWYRQLSKYWQKINFIKYTQEILDQPSLYDWLKLPDLKPQRWGAVLGQPVYFSRSPLIHQDFFLKQNSFFTKIDISQQDFKEHYLFLHQLGLSYAAVTSPLKEVAYSTLDFKSDTAAYYQSANTLFYYQSQIYGHNTDGDGFGELIKKLDKSSQIAIWGGGGTLKMLKDLLPQAVLFSSQTGEPRQIQSEQITHFDVLVWAAPRTEQTQWPAEGLKFDSVIDLNYTENSMGLEFAVNRKISYISGLEMFNAQAKSQQMYWRSQELKQKNNLI